VKSLFRLVCVTLLVMQAVVSSAGLITQSGPRLYVAADPGPGPSQLYEWDDDVPYAYVDPEKTSSGSGTLEDPYNPTQGLAITASSEDEDRVVLWLQGTLTVNGANAAGQKYPTLVPASGASATRRVIHKAQYPGDPARATRLTRGTGGGTLIGFWQSEFVVIDGFVIESLSGSPQTQAGGGSGEVALVGFWESENVAAVRMYLDMLGDHFGTDGNRSVVHIEFVDGFELADSYITSTGSTLTGGAPHNTTGIMIFNSANGSIHHNTLEVLPTAIWSKGQREGIQVANIDIHHNRVDESNGGIVISNPIQTNPANWVRVYQNVVTRAQIALAAKSYGSNEPAGIAFVNNTVGNGYRYESGTWQPGGFVTQGPAGSFVDGTIVVRNNAYVNVYACNWTYTDGSHTDRLRWDYNGCSGYTQFAGDPEGSSISVSAWQGDTPPRDEHGLFDDTDPLFADAENGDFRLESGSPYRNAATDYLNLLGNGTNGPINIGAYITSDMSDQIGRRQ
jgi:hypothetical protein